MIIHAVITYEQSYLPPRCRTERKVFLKAATPLEVKGILAKDAPVAARLELPRHSRRYDDHTPEDLRWFDGHLWAKWHAEYEGRDLATSIARACQGGYDWQIREAQDANDWYAGQPAGTRYESGRNAAELRAQAEADKFLFIAGEVWRRAWEPYLTVTWGGFSRRSWLEIKTANADDPEPRGEAWTPRTFALPQLAEAKAYLRDRRNTDVDVYAGEATVPYVEVLIPEAFRLTPQTWALEKGREDFANRVDHAMGWGNSLDEFAPAVAIPEMVTIMEQKLAALKEKAAALV